MIPQDENTSRNWRQRLAVALCGMGIALSLAGALEAKPEADSEGWDGRKPRPRNVSHKATAEFEARFARLSIAQPFILADYDEAKNYPSHIFRKAYKNLGGKGAEQGAALMARFLAGCAREAGGGPVSGWWRVKAASGTADMLYAFDVPDDMSFASALASVSSHAGRNLRKDAGLEYDQLLRIVLYHEVFGHCTESLCPHVKNMAIDAEHVDDFTYNRTLEELRADIASLVGMARDEGSTVSGRKLVHLRALHMFHDESDAPYDNIPELDAVNDRLDVMLANPQAKAALMAADDRGLVGMVDRLFGEVMPTPQKQEMRFDIHVGAQGFHSQNTHERERVRTEMEDDPVLAFAVVRAHRRAEKAMDALLEPARAPCRNNSHPEPTP